MIKIKPTPFPLKKSFLFFCVLAILVWLTYSNHFNNAFHFDDSHTIENNLFIQDIKNIPLFFTDATTFSSLPQNQSYRPIVSTSLAIDYYFGKCDLFYFHLSSFIFFLLQGFLMLYFIFKIFDSSFKSKNTIVLSTVAVALYLLHPANAETINYIIARSDLHSTFFVILAFVIYIQSSYCRKTFLYLIPVGIGVLAKPPAVMFAPLLFFYVLLFEENLGLMDVFKKKNFQKTKHAILKTLPAFIFCVFMYKWIDSYTPPTWQSGGSSAFNYLITQPFVILHYFTTFFAPIGLSADSDWVALETIWNPKFFAGIIFILFLTFVSIKFSKNKISRPVSFGIIWFFLALIPSSSIIPFAEVLNDHRIYFPYVGLIISVCWMINLLIMKYNYRYPKLKKQIVICVVTLVFIALSGFTYGTYKRNEVWKTDESLWLDVTIKSPLNGRGLMNYGLSKMRIGDYNTAETYFLKALKIWPNYSYLYVNMGVLKEAMAQPLEAEKYFKQGILLGQNYPDAWFLYGRFLFNQNRMQESIDALEHANALSQAHTGARSLLMKAFQITQNWLELQNLAKNTLATNPQNDEAMQYLSIANSHIANK